MFFFYCSGHLPYLHSFPTRRSSDLKQLKLKDVTLIKADYGELPDLDQIDSATDVVFTWNGTTSVAESIRSEEHTSELQSPDHLVCRLLLEKKKKQKKNKQITKNKKT